MGIQPIDLQTIYTQLDKVSKTQVQLTQAAQLQDAMNHEKISRKQAEDKSKVEKPSDLAEELDVVRERRERSEQQKRDEQRKQRGGAGAEDEPPRAYFSDPDLGQHIDVTG